MNVCFVVSSFPRLFPQSALFDESCADRVEALVAGRAAVAGLVVCASLLDNVPNLAGLCRWAWQQCSRKTCTPVSFTVLFVGVLQGSLLAAIAQY
jgi:hypothetical protein